MPNAAKMAAMAPKTTIQEYLRAVWAIRVG
jgi:hypothetical protein